MKTLNEGRLWKMEQVWGVWVWEHMVVSFYTVATSHEVSQLDRGIASRRMTESKICTYNDQISALGQLGGKRVRDATSLRYAPCLDMLQ